MISDLWRSYRVGGSQPEPGLNRVRGDILAERLHTDAIELPFAVLVEAGRTRTGYGAIRRADHLHPVEIDDDVGSCDLKMDPMHRPSQERDSSGRTDLCQSAIVLEELQRLRIGALIVADLQAIAMIGVNPP